MFNYYLVDRTTQIFLKMSFYQIRLPLYWSVKLELKE